MRPNALGALVISFAFGVAPSALASKLVDIPDFIVLPQDVELGLRIKETDTNTATVSSVIGSSTIGSQKTTTARLQSDKRTLLNEVSSSISASSGLSADKVFSLKIDAKFDTSNRDTHELTWSDVHTYDESLAYTKSATATEDRSRSKSAKTEDDSGYIHTGFTITNNSNVPITFNHIRANVVLVESSDSDHYDAIASAVLKNGLNTYPGQASQIESPDKRPEDLQITLASGQQYVQVINFEKLNTNQLLRWIASDKWPQLRVSYDLHLNSEPSLYSVSSKIDAALREGVHLIVLGPNLSARQFYVGGDPPDRKVSVLSALATAGYAVEVRRNDNQQLYISRLGAWKADCPPSDLSNIRQGLESPMEGAWVVSAEGGFEGTIDEAAPPGTRFVVAFVTRRNRLRSMAEHKRLEGLSLPAWEEAIKLVQADIDHREWPNTDQVNQRSANYVPIGFVRVGDVVTLWIQGLRTCFKIADFVLVEPDPSFTLPNIPAGWFTSDFIKWANAIYHRPDCSTWAKMTDEEIWGEHGLSLDFGGGPIALRSVLPKGKQWRDVYPDSTVRLRFVVSEKMLRNGPTVLRLVMNQAATNSLLVGRSVAWNPALPQPPVPFKYPNLGDAPGAATYWANRDPLRNQTVSEQTSYAIDSEVISEPSASPKERVFHAFSHDESAALATAERLWAAVTAGKKNEIFENFAPNLLAKMDKDAWFQQLIDTREKLGPIRNRELLRVRAVKFSEPVGDLPVGTYVSVVARTEFTNHSESRHYVVEYILLEREKDGDWRIASLR